MHVGAAMKVDAVGTSGRRVVLDRRYNIEAGGLKAQRESAASREQVQHTGTLAVLQALKFLLDSAGGCRSTVATRRGAMSRKGAGGVFCVCADDTHVCRSRSAF